MKKKLPACLALLAATQAPLSLAKTYTVKKGDTLSRIASQELGHPVYGSQGTLQRVLDLNQDIRNKDRIYPQQTIRLSDEKEAVAAAPAPEPETPPQAPATETASTAAPAAAESTDSAHASFGFRIAGILSKDHMDIRAKDRSYKTDLDSRLNKGLDLQFYYSPTANLRLGVDGEVLESRFQDSSDGRFEGTHKALKKLALFGDLTLAQSWHLGLQLGTEQAFFFTQKDAATFQLEPVFVDFAKASLGYDFIHSESWRLGAAVVGGYYDNNNEGEVSVSKGSSYGAQLLSAWRVGEKTSLEAEAFYQKRSQGTDLTQQKTRTTGVLLGVRYEF